MKYKICVSLLSSLFLILFSSLSYAQETIPFPSVNFGLGEAESPRDVALSLQIIFIFTILAVAPSIVILMTCFTRIIIVFHFLRTAMGTAQMPPNQIMAGMALLLTFYIMTPVLAQVNSTAIAPYMNEEITFREALASAKVPVRKFLISNTRRQDLILFLELSKSERPRTVDDIPDLVVLGAFVMSEVQVAFQIGFLLFLPFLILDFVISSVLLAMGMMMLPPVMISVPFKILLFVLVDGWALLITALVKSYY